MKPPTMKFGPTVVGAFVLFVLIIVATCGCGTTTVIHQTVLVGVTVAPGKSAATATPTSAPKPSPGIWCLVKRGQMALSSACEIYPSPPQLYTPTQGEAGLAGTFVGPAIGENGPDSITERMNSPSAADVLCGTDGTGGSYGSAN